ncbi:MAG: sigma-70 family RNA polymerase sigma factor [bacterium]
MLAGISTTDATTAADFELIQAFRAGDDQAFTALVQKYQQHVFNLIFHHSGPAVEVEDLAQEVFLKIYAKLKNFQGRASFRTWLYRVTLNVCIDHARKKKVRRMLSLESLSEWAKARLSLRNTASPSPQAEAEAGELRGQIQRALAQLPEEFRQPLILRDVEGLEYGEIAAITGTQLGTVKSRIFRGRQRLRELLAPYRKEVS